MSPGSRGKSAGNVRGRPFQVGHDPRRKPGPGRPKKEYLEALRAMAPEALAVLQASLRDERQRLAAAKDILDRAYGKAVETTKIEADAAATIVVTTPRQL